MPSSIKSEYSKPAKPLVKSKTVWGAFIGFGTILAEHIFNLSPVIAMFIWSLLPDWLKGVLALDVIQTGIEALIYAITGYAGIVIVKERAGKEDIKGVLRSKESE